MYLEVKPQSGIPWENSPLGMAYDGFPCVRLVVASFFQGG